MSPPGTRVCRTCGHTLSLEGVQSCPECGREYDSDNPRSTTDNYRRWRQGRIVGMVHRSLIVFLVLYVILLGLLSVVGSDILMIGLLGFAGLPVVAIAILLGLYGLFTDAPIPHHRHALSVILPILLVSIVVTGWPFRLTFLLHASALDRLADQEIVVDASTGPKWVGLIRVIDTEFPSTDGRPPISGPPQPRCARIQLSGDSGGGMFLVRDRTGLGRDCVRNANWILPLGGSWFWVDED